VWRYEFEGGGIKALEGVGTVKTLTFEKGGGCMTRPAPVVAPPLGKHDLTNCYQEYITDKDIFRTNLHK